MKKDELRVVTTRMPVRLFDKACGVSCLTESKIQKIESFTQ